MALLKTGVSGSANASVGMGSSANRSSAPAAGATGPGGWHPTVMYMLALVVLEVVVVAFLSKHLLK